MPPGRGDSPSASSASWVRAPSCLRQGSSSSSGGCQRLGCLPRRSRAVALWPRCAVLLSLHCYVPEALACAPPRARHHAHCAIIADRLSRPDCARWLFLVHGWSPRSHPALRPGLPPDHAGSMPPPRWALSPAVVPHYPGGLLQMAGRKDRGRRGAPSRGGLPVAVARKDPGVGRPAQL